MYAITPMISTFDEALEHISIYGRPGALWYDAFPQAFVLAGGSLKHPVWITLTYAIEGHRNFGRYVSYECYRLVIRDGLYRTKYHLESDEHAKFKTMMADFCRERRLCVRVLSHSTMPEYLEKAAQEFFAGFNVQWRVYSPRRRLKDELAFFKDQYQDAFDRLHVAIGLDQSSDGELKTLVTLALNRLAGKDATLAELRTILHIPDDVTLADGAQELIVEMVSKIQSLHGDNDRLYIERNEEVAAIQSKMEQLHRLITDYATTPMTFEQFIENALGQARAAEILSEDRSETLLEEWHERM